VWLSPSAPWHLTTNSGGGIYFAGDADADGPVFGLSDESSVSGTVLFDVDGNGNYSPGDGSMGGVTVWGDTNQNGQYDPGEPITTTGSDGTFQLGDIPPPSNGGGCHVIHVDPPEGWQPTSPGGNVIDVPVGPPTTDLPPVTFVPTVTGSISGKVFDDLNQNGSDEAEDGLAGLTVTLSASNGYTLSTTTDGPGQYIFCGLPPRSYNVSVTVPDNWHVTSANPASATVSGSSPQQTVNFGLVENVSTTQYGSISGTIWDDRSADGQWQEGEPGLPSVGVYATEIDYTQPDSGCQYYAGTDGNGLYSFGGLVLGGSYQITVSIADRRPTDGSGINYVFSVSTDVTGIDQGWTWGMITGAATTDPATYTAGVAGVPVTLLDAGGQPMAATTSGDGGAFTFTNLDPSVHYYSVVGGNCTGYRYDHGTYGIEVPTNSLIGSGYVYMLPAPGSISGTVYEDADNDGTISAGDVGSYSVEQGLYNDGRSSHDMVVHTG
jgi:hypothetical protein